MHICIHTYMYVSMYILYVYMYRYRYKYIDMILVLPPLFFLKLTTEESDFRMSSESFSYNHLTCGISGSPSLKNCTHGHNEILQIFFRRLQTL